jgi:hypothetical protein
MDKQQATDHIIARLRAGFQADEIAEELSRLLKVPTEKVGPYVNRVVASHSELIAPTQTDFAVDKSEVQELDEISHEVTQSSPAADSIGVTGFHDLPPGLQTIVLEAQITGGGLAKPAPTSKPQENPEMPPPLQADFVAPPDKRENSQIDREALEEFALKQLKKQRRHNDIVEAVCQKTGWHWNKSQRFVAQLQTRHHDELQSGKNRVTMIVGIGIILAGLIMALNGISALSDYAKIAVFAKTNPEVLLDVPASAIFFALSATVTGIGMVLGGGYGIARALTTR